MGRSKAKCYLEEVNVCKPKPIPQRILVNNTVFVDGEYGKTSGEPNNPAKPFKTISVAIDAIKNIVKTELSQWSIRINPGTYNEDIIVPVFININGSGINTTFIRNITVNGTSNISNLTIGGTINTQLNNEQAEQNSVSFNNVRMTSINNSVNINGSGFNNIVTFRDSEITVDKVVNLININGALELINTDVTLFGDFQDQINMFNINDQLRVDGGSFKLSVNDAPAQPVNLFNFDNGGSLTMTNNNSSVQVLILQHEYKADVSYINSKNATIINVNNSTAYLDGVSVDFLNLVNNESLGADINLLGLTTPLISVPRLKGFTNNIKYNISSGDGDIVASGGIYANIIKVGITGHENGYFVQENDFTILSEGIDVNVFDPKLANEQVLDKGKLIIIRNIGTRDININGQNNSIFDGPQVLAPNASSLLLQNNGEQWFKL